MKSKLLFLGFLLVLGIIAGCSSDSAPVKKEKVEKFFFPENFPADIPIYPSSTLSNFRDYEDEESWGASFALVGIGSVADVYGWYYDAMTSNGWTLKSDKTVAGYRILKAEKNNLYTTIQATKGSEENSYRISQQVKVFN